MPENLAELARPAVRPMTPGPGPAPYAGPVCPEPECNRVAYAYRGGHAPDCRYWAPTPPRRPR